MVRVIRIDNGFAVVGQSQNNSDETPVSWTVQTFTVNGRTEAEAEAEANATALSFGAKLPPWFSGRAYIVDSAGGVVEVTVDLG